jgi:hypothetical protein
MATKLPTDMLHRATLITTALLPVHNHFFMALTEELQHTTEL